jgi:AcrR family transcriptional regulator
VPTQTERSDSTRHELLEAARELFQQRGYTEVGVDEICALAGVTSGALYHHFENKAGLFRAVYEGLMAATSERIAAARRGNPAPSLYADCELYLDACSDPSFFRITTDAPSVIGWDLLIDDTQRLIVSSLEIARAEQEIPSDIPIPATARMLAAALKEAGLMIATAADPVQARTEASASAAHLIAGLTR